MNIIGTYSYFQLEVLHFYQIHRNFLTSLCHFPMLAPLQYWYTLVALRLFQPFLCVLGAELNQSQLA